jgi:hypothetical protein
VTCCRRRDRTLETCQSIRYQRHVARVRYPNTPNVPNAQTKIAYSFGTGFSSRIFNCSHRRFRHQFKRRERYSGIHLPLRKSPNAHQDWDPFVGCTTHLVQFVLCRLGRN